MNNFADGPEITDGPKQHFVLSGDSVSLVCGYNLDSNPPAIITWTDPKGDRVVNNGRYILDDGPKVVQLNISTTSKSDSGIWVCSVLVNKHVLDKDQINIQEEMTTKFNISLEVLGMFVQSSLSLYSIYIFQIHSSS